MTVFSQWSYDVYIAKALYVGGNVSCMGHALYVSLRPSAIYCRLSVNPSVSHVNSATNKFISLARWTDTELV
jgi:hypothetical protein